MLATTIAPTPGQLAKLTAIAAKRRQPVEFAIELWQERAAMREEGDVKKRRVAESDALIDVAILLALVPAGPTSSRTP